MLGQTALTTDGVDVPITRCRSCFAPVWWGVTRKGKRCPFDCYTLDSGDVVASGISHFRSCKDARDWTRKPTAREAVPA